ncbi:hypothetical transposase, partial [Brucella abortus bv. 1 str. 9-941]
SHHAIAVLKAAVAYYASLGVTVTRVMTDNGACYIRQGLQGARSQAHSNQALYAKNQRQGRALHSDRITGVGLCTCIPIVTDPQSASAKLDTYVQLASTS